MMILGLTGSIGMGKTTAGKMLSIMGCGIHSADESVHKLLKPDGDAFEEVAVTFPEAWDKKKHVIKRDVLAEIIFSDSEKKQILEEILHPWVRYHQNQFIKAQKNLGREAIVMDIPLLFETGAQSRFDYTLCVHAPHHIQRRRVLSREGMTEEKFHAILAAQMPSIKKCQLADFTVPTGLGYAYSFKILKNILRSIIDA